MEKPDEAHIEHADSPCVVAESFMPPTGAGIKATSGDFKLIIGDDTILLPTPSPSPKDPLNLPAWRKWALLILVSAYGCASVVLCSGLGAIFPVVLLSYAGQEEKAQDLMIYPTLFMGIGNLISMPFSNIIGRRPIFLLSCALLLASSVWCARSDSLGSHIAGRNVMALAAGQSEALAPTMVEEIYFLHERARKITWFVVIETTFVAVFLITSTHLVSAWGWPWWYGFFAIFNGVVLVLSLYLVPETLYSRSESTNPITDNPQVITNSDGDKLELHITIKQGVVLDHEKYGYRDWKHDMKLWDVQGQWSDSLIFFKDLLLGFCHPLMFWLLLLNGSFLGVYIFQASTFASILLSPPYTFAFNSLGYVQGAQIFVCMVSLPVLGYGSDYLVKIMSRKNNGFFRPEYRFIVLSIPTISGVISAILFGKAAASPEKYHWSAVVVSFNIVFFAFVGANTVALTYTADSFPQKVGPLYVVICAGRGFISFGLSYAVIPSIKAIGYDGTMTAEGVICAVLSAIAIPMYFLGPRLRKLGQRNYGFGTSKKNSDK